MFNFNHTISCGFCDYIYIYNVYIYIYIHLSAVVFWLLALHISIYIYMCVYDPLTYRHAKTTASYFHTCYFHMFYIGWWFHWSPTAPSICHEQPSPVPRPSSSHGWRLGMPKGTAASWAVPYSRPFVRLLLNLKPKSLSELQATIGKDCPLVNEQPSSRYKSW